MKFLRFGKNFGEISEIRWFLKNFFLGITIQSNTHDSTEDASTALRLYRRHQELMQKGEQEFHGTLNRLYETGRSLNWQVEDWILYIFWILFSCLMMLPEKQRRTKTGFHCLGENLKSLKFQEVPSEQYDIVHP